MNGKISANVSTWLTTLLMASALLYQSSAGAGITVLEITDGSITMQASRVSLTDVAKAISEESEIDITATEGEDQLVDIDLYNMPFLPAIARISPNHIVVQKTIAGEKLVTGVTFILDYGQSNGGDFNLPSGEPADEIAQEEMPNVEPTDLKNEAIDDPNAEEQPYDQSSQQ